MSLADPGALSLRLVTSWAGNGFEREGVGDICSARSALDCDSPLPLCDGCCLSESGRGLVHPNGSRLVAPLVTKSSIDSANALSAPCNHFTNTSSNSASQSARGWTRIAP